MKTSARPKPKRPLPAHLEKFKFAKGHKRATKPAPAAATPGATPGAGPAPAKKSFWELFWGSD